MKASDSGYYLGCECELRWCCIDVKKQGSIDILRKGEVLG